MSIGRPMAGEYGPGEPTRLATRLTYQVPARRPLRPARLRAGLSARVGRERSAATLKGNAQRQRSMVTLGGSAHESRAHECTAHGERILLRRELLRRELLRRERGNAPSLAHPR
jgi:hypothetical protein